MLLTSENYFSNEAARQFWSVSQFKAFDRCEAAGLAEASGLYTREDTDALLIGSYVDAYFSGSEAFGRFHEKYGDQMFTKKGELYAKFRTAFDMINCIEGQPLAVDYLSGDRQVVMAAELFGMPWKAKLDVYNDQRIVDLKTVRNFDDIYDPAYGTRRSWVEFWRYDIQGSIYQRIEQKVSGRSEPLPFYLVAVTKERVPDIKVLQIPQHVLDAAYHLVEAKIERYDLIKNGEVEPMRCERCDYCKATKILTAPEVYEIEEAR